MRKKRIVIISGGFDPLHVGHIRLMRDAASYGDELFVILNNDAWLKRNKGCIFMSQAERKEILLALNCVSKVILTTHRKDYGDLSVDNQLRRIALEYGKHKLIFANGGNKEEDNIPERDLCEKLGIEMIFGIGGRQIQHSSELIEQVGLL